MSRSQRDRSRSERRKILLLGLVLIVLAMLVRVADPLPLRNLRLSYFDYLQTLSPRAAVDLPVRVVDIDEASLSEFGQWPWPRSYFADLLDRLDALGAAVVAFDVLFAEPDRYSPANLVRDPAIRDALGSDLSLGAFDNDQRLAEAMSGRAVVLGVAAREGKPAEVIPPKAGLVEIGEQPATGLFEMTATTPLAPPLGAAAAGIGGINIAPGLHSGTIRQVPLLWRGPTGPMPGLALEALRLALGETTIFLDGVPGLAGAVQLIGLGPFQIPTDPNGQIWVRYRPNDPAMYVSARDILQGGDEDLLRPFLEGHIVFVGTSAAGLLDTRSTALGETVPGVSIHAQIVEQILQGEMLRRSDLMAGLEMIAFLLLGASVTLVCRRSGAGAMLLAGAAPGLLVVLTSWWAFRHLGILFDATFPLLGGATNFAILLAWRFLVVDRDKRQIRRSFSYYVSPEVLGEIEAGGHKLELGGVNREVTVLFSDIRDFTPLSAGLPPQALVSFLNGLFTEQGAAILEQQGTIDKFIGDAIMAFWNAPLDIPDHPLKAAQAALGMRARLKPFNERQIWAGRLPIAMAVGCARGEVCVGNIGARQRFNYTVIGEAVNAAARIESSCRRLDYDIAVSADVAASIGDRLALLPAGAPALKGISERSDLYIVVGDGHVASSPAFDALSQAHTELLTELRAGQDALRAVANCLELSHDVDPGLERFYMAIPKRVDDFCGIGDQPAVGTSNQMAAITI
ncbi:CHASE2 domain-containing protein [Aliiruegeria sabulilitoris]|uniref:CHASE2 domain-containing protein n=1 Tax=Aliiruegeria sabulilitoris TaxID=1510458 RepID=UPI00083624A2|nr:adenylate/guanylate cyclase domain-containing protein [Aliiruegeria sabulilitoris]NDR59571.1 adenylate/guanylate cyclase domain-containing protein [Pseudoruegeria sp. M32A2M]